MPFMILDVSGMVEVVVAENVTAILRLFQITLSRTHLRRKMFLARNINQIIKLIWQNLGIHFFLFLLSCPGISLYNTENDCVLGGCLCKCALFNVTLVSEIRLGLWPLKVPVPLIHLVFQSDAKHFSSKLCRTDVLKRMSIFCMF